MPTSYNGYPASPRPADFGGLEPLVVAGEAFAPGVRAGAVRIVLEYVAEQINARVEPAVRADWHQADDWGYNYRPNRNNPASLSCHASGTAIDYNATRHPNGKRGTWTAEQLAEVRRILAEVEGTVRHLAGDAGGTVDAMHFEVIKPLGDVERVAARITANGGPERRLGAAPTPARPAPPAPGRRVLRLTDPHMTGQDVGDVQDKLRGGFPAYRHESPVKRGQLLGVDRDYGAHTEAWVRLFQAKSRLTVDGVVGPATYRALGL